MKKLHLPEIYCWSEFNKERNIDFHSYVWLRNEGNIIFDPLPLSQHDFQHLQSFGRISHILLSNSDHLRYTQQLAVIVGAQIWGPLQEKETFPIPCHDWLQAGDERIRNLKVFEMSGSKTPGELAFMIEGHTLVTGDLIRAHEGGRLCLLPDAKLSDKEAARHSVRALANIESIEAILTGDGWPVFRDGHRVLKELVATF